jgi:hypothetical protein
MQKSFKYPIDEIVWNIFMRVSNYVNDSVQCGASLSCEEQLNNNNSSDSIADIPIHINEVID